MNRYSPLFAIFGVLAIAAGVFIHTAASSAAPACQTLEPFTDQACLDCHTDQGRLMALAVEEEEVHEALSSGPG
jgi:hypothetical protein